MIYKIIFQVDDDESITSSAVSLYGKKHIGESIKLWYRWDRKANKAVLVQGLEGFAKLSLGDKPVIEKLIITGHGGAIDDKTLTIGGFKAEELAKKVEGMLSQLLSDPEPSSKVTIQRITLDSCLINKAFGDRFWQAIKDSNQKIIVQEARIYEGAMVSTSKSGHRFTTKMEPEISFNMVTRYKDRSIRRNWLLTKNGTEENKNNVDANIEAESKGIINMIEATRNWLDLLKVNGTGYLDVCVIDSVLINLSSGDKFIKFLQLDAANVDYLVLQPSFERLDLTTYILRSAYNQDDAPLYKDIPKIPTDESPAKFLFTQTLTGGSLIVTEHPEPERSDYYRVYHDTRINASVFYDKVVMAVDYEDYALTAEETGYAASTAFLYYGGEDGHETWKIANQPLNLSGEPNSKPAQRSKRKVSIADKDTSFVNYNHKRIKAKVAEQNETIIKLQKKYNKNSIEEVKESINKIYEEWYKENPTEEEEKKLNELNEDWFNIEDASAYLPHIEFIYRNQENYHEWAKNLQSSLLKVVLNKNQSLFLKDIDQTSYASLQVQKLFGEDLNKFKATAAASDLFAANKALLNKDHEYVPLIHAIEPAGFQKVNIPVLDTTTFETVTLTTGDMRLSEFRDYVNEQTRALTEGDPVEGLNTAMAIQALMGLFARPGRNQDSSPLAKALEIHVYFNLVQAGYGGLSDMYKLVRLTQSVYSNGIIATAGVASRVSGALSHVAEGAGVVLGVGNMVLDSIELSKANTSSQKAIFGTQLAFDTAGTLLSVTGIGAGLLGATAAGAVLSGAGVLLGGLAVGFAGLAQAFGKVADDAEQVGMYFDLIFKAYQKGYYIDNTGSDPSTKIARIDFGAVVTELNLYSRKVRFGSQRLYRTHHGDTGSGKEDYFFWAGDMPEEVHDPVQAIDVRLTWNANKARNTPLPDINPLPEEMHSDIPIVLPATPGSYIGYQFNVLPGATTKHATGFDLWRIMEQDERFDFDFYIFPSERIIDTLYHEYIYGFAINIVLDRQDRQLIVPPFSENVKGYIYYHIQSQGNQCVINLDKGANIFLSAAEGSSGAKWILDPGPINEDFTFKDGHLKLGESVQISTEGTAPQEILVIRKNKEMCIADWNAQTFTPVQEDGSQWNTQDLQNYLKGHAEAHEQYVLIKNFEPSKGNNAGNAFYDVKNDRFLYTSGLAFETADSATLVGVLDNHAVFFSKSQSQIWSTSIDDPAQFKAYSLLLSGAAAQIEKAWILGGVVSVLQTFLPEGASLKTELIYQIDNGNPTLLGIFRADYLIQQLSATNPLPPDTDLTKFILDGILHPANPTADKESVSPGTAPALGEFITLTTLLPNGSLKLLWLNSRKKTVITPNLIAIQGIDVGTGYLSLVQCIPNKKGQTVHYFLYNSNPDGSPSDAPVANPKPVRLFLQIADGNAFEVQIPGLLYTMSQDNRFFVTNNEGKIFYIDTEGNIFLEALTAVWLKNNSEWWKALLDLNKTHLFAHPSISVLGLFVSSDGNKTAFPVWYDVAKKSIAIAPVALFKNLAPENANPDPAFLGVAEQKRGAYFLDAVNYAVYWQPLPIYRQLDAACSNRTDNIDLSALPGSRRMLKDKKIINAYVDNDMLHVVLDEGLLLSVSPEENINIVAVLHNWVLQHKTDLVPALEKLCEAYQYQEEVLGVFAANDPNDNTLSWYLPARKALLTPAVQPGQVLNYMGYNAARQTAYFADMQKSVLLAFKDKKFSSLFSFGWASRLPGLFTVIGSEKGNSISLPVLDNCDSLLLATHFGSNEYTIGLEAWEHYTDITIDNRGTTQDVVRLPFSDFSQLAAIRQGGDLIMGEVTSGRYLTLKNAFDPGNRGVLMLTSGSTAINSAKVVTIMNAGKLASLDLNMAGLALKRVKIIPVNFPNQRLRMDGAGLIPHSIGGSVNGKFYDVGLTEQFYLADQADGTVALESVAFPGVYLHMDAKTVTQFLSTGGGVVNCLFDLGPQTKFRIIPQGAGVAFASEAFPGVYLRYDGSNLVGAPNGKIGGVANCQFGAKSLEIFNISPV